MFTCLAPIPERSLHAPFVFILLLPPLQAPHYPPHMLFAVTSSTSPYHTPHMLSLSAYTRASASLGPIRSSACHAI